MSDYDDDERPSWREIDKQRDRSRHTSEPRKDKVGDLPKDRWKSGRVKEALGRIFEGEKGTVEHDKLFHKIHHNYGTGKFLSAVQRYIAKYGLPDDIPTLLLVLDTKEPAIMVETMMKLKELNAGAPGRLREDIRRKISIISMTDASKEVRREAEDILAELRK